MPIAYAVKVDEADRGMCTPSDSVPGVSEAKLRDRQLVLIIPRAHKCNHRRLCGE
jgi:hypothetical protein